MPDIQVNPMTEKDYIAWYKEKYNCEPPYRFLKTCIDNYQRELTTPSDEWLKELLDEEEEWLKELLDEEEEWLK